jgi:hypothetical protein
VQILLLKQFVKQRWEIPNSLSISIPVNKMPSYKGARYQNTSVTLVYLSVIPDRFPESKFQLHTLVPFAVTRRFSPFSVNACVRSASSVRGRVKKQQKGTSDSIFFSLSLSWQQVGPFV